MKDYLAQDLEYFLGKLKADIDLISDKKKEEEWKRDHYRYAFIVTSQRIFNTLNTALSQTPPSGLQESTRNELIVLRDLINEMLGEKSG